MWYAYFQRTRLPNKLYLPSFYFIYGGTAQQHGIGGGNANSVNISIINIPR